MFFIIVCTLAAIAQWHFIVFVIDEMTTALSIRVFRVKPVGAEPFHAIASPVRGLCFRLAFLIKYLTLIQKQIEETPFRVFGGNQTTDDQVGIEMPEIGGGRYSRDQESEGAFKASAGKYGMLN